MTDSLSKMEQSIIVESPLVMHFGNRPVSYSRISILDSQYCSCVGKEAYVGVRKWYGKRGPVEISTYVHLLVGIA